MFCIGYFTMQKAFLSIIAWVVAGILAFDTAAAQDIKITDYDVPVSEAHELTVRSDLGFIDQADYRRDFRSSHYSLLGLYNGFYNSLPFAWSVKAETYVNWFESDKQSLKMSEAVSVESSVRKYVSDEGIFFGGMNINSAWEHGNHRPNVRLDIFAGIGRFVEATAVVRAVRINEFLRAEGILDGFLPRETLLTLASMIDRESEYRRQYGRTYPVWWYADMDRLISQQAGLTGGTVGGVGLLRLREVIEQEHVRRRVYGWKVEIGANIPVAAAKRSNPGDAKPFVAGTFALPFGLKHQVIAQANAYSLTGEWFGKLYGVNSTIVYTLELTNKIDLIVTETFDLRKYPIGRPGNWQYWTRYNQDIRTSAIYYVENTISINFAASLSHHHSNRYPESRRRSWGVRGSINYHVY